MALLAVAAAICIAACGGSSNAASTTKAKASTTTTSTTSKANGFAALRTCLSKHGVTLPSGTGRGGAGGGFFGRRGTHTGTTGTGTPPAGGTGTTPAGGAPGGGGGFAGGGFAGGANSKYAKAFKACGGKLGGFGGGGFRGGAGGGYPGGAGGGYPGGAGAGHFRPSFSKATLTAFVACVRKNGYAAMPEAKKTSTGGFFPASIEKNADFLKASAKCDSILQKSFRGVNPGGPNQSATTTTSSSSST